MLDQHFMRNCTVTIPPQQKLNGALPIEWHTPPMEPTVIVATTKRYVVFRVPEDVTLLPVSKRFTEQGSSGLEGFLAKTPWSWRIQRGTLRYWDAGGTSHEIPGKHFGTDFDDEVHMDEFNGAQWGEMPVYSDDEEETHEPSFSLEELTRK